MKFSLSLVLAATLCLSGCSLFRESPTWNLVVHNQRGAEAEADSKSGGYINRLHLLLAGAGVEHKVVSYQFHWLNVYRETAMEAGVAIIYRDDTTPANPWWIIDEYHHVPVWVPNGTLESQVAFFIQQRVDIISVKSYAADAPSGKQVARTGSRRDRAFAETRPGRAYRELFATGKTPRLSVAKVKKETPAPAPAGIDERAVQVFRSAHGTSFDPNSSVDREKMGELRRRLLSRNQIVRLRAE